MTNETDEHLAEPVADEEVREVVNRLRWLSGQFKSDTSNTVHEDTAEAANLIERLAANQVPEGHVAVPKDAISLFDFPAVEGFDVTVKWQRWNEIHAMLAASEGEGK